MVGRREGWRTFGRPTHRWEDKIKIDHQRFGPGRNRLDCSGSGYRQMVDACECGSEISDCFKCGGFILLGDERSASQEDLCSMELV